MTGLHHHDRDMMNSDTLLLAMLDQDWRARCVIPLADDWRGTFSRLLDEDSCWLALIQQRADNASPMPKAPDILLTRMLARRLRPLDMKLADHVIHAGKSHFSFRAAGLL